MSNLLDSVCYLSLIQYTLKKGATVFLFFFKYYNICENHVKNAL